MEEEQAILKDSILRYLIDSEIDEGIVHIQIGELSAKLEQDYSACCVACEELGELDYIKRSPEANSKEYPQNRTINIRYKGMYFIERTSFENEYEMEKERLD